MIKWQKDFQKARALTFDPAQYRRFPPTVHSYRRSLSSGLSLSPFCWRRTAGEGSRMPHLRSIGRKANATAVGV